MKYETFKEVSTQFDILSSLKEIKTVTLQSTSTSKNSTFLLHYEADYNVKNP